MTKEELEYSIRYQQDSYKEFYIAYFNKLYNYGKKFSADTFLIKDAIQEVFLDLWANREKWKNVQSIDSYLFSSFRYILFKKIKEAAKMISGGAFEAEPEFAVDQLRISQEVDAETQSKLKKALETLTPRQREAIFLRFYQNLSYEEVAAVLNISVKATYKIMARSLSSLKEMMKFSTAFLIMLLRSTAPF